MIKEDTLNKIYKFREDRDWNKFHNPKDLAISISIESAELLECFQWKNKNIDDIYSDSKLFHAIQDELADILIYALYLAKDLNLDLDQVVNNKIDKNSFNYPIEKCKGTSTKYTNL